MISNILQILSLQPRISQIFSITKTTFSHSRSERNNVVFTRIIHSHIVRHFLIQYFSKLLLHVCIWLEYICANKKICMNSNLPSSSQIYILDFWYCCRLCVWRMLPFDLGENKDAILSINTYLFYIHIHGYTIRRKYHPKERFSFSMINLLFHRKDFLYFWNLFWISNKFTSFYIHKGKLKISYRQSKIGIVKLF